ncbi:hypothetical protein J5N97_024043 [Dioscorea zingiberensis]|uniref:Caffeic acid O-methyltransferase n=1 Tax=Dioscorea zingiberensis TaxID=325984 RepID=A0A9D5H8E4_9LILI|nr:hypothetical protein J5N97_024043 [Dioscorea zingiberensis]
MALEGEFDRAMKLAASTAMSMTLKAVVELGVLEIIASAGPGARLSPEEIVSQIQTTNAKAPEVLDRMLRLLVSADLLTCEVVAREDGKIPRRYGLAPVCKYLTKDEDGASVAAMLLMHHDKVTVDAWLNLKYAVLDGTIPFVKAHGMTAFDYHGKDPRFNEVFNKCMFNHTTILMKKILEMYKGFEGLHKLVDVGGGLGATLEIILSKYPHIKGINFDLPYVVSEAPPIPRLEHVGGDMFDSVPSGDAIFMKWILHDWSDEHCVKLLKNCWNALPENGKVIVAEIILPEIPEVSDEANHSFIVDLCMMAYYDGGKERTKKDFECLAKKSGFSGFKAVCYVFGFWIMEFHK